MLNRGYRDDGKENGDYYIIMGYILGIIGNMRLHYTGIIGELYSRIPYQEPVRNTYLETQPLMNICPKPQHVARLRNGHSHGRVGSTLPNPSSPWRAL